MAGINKQAVTLQQSTTSLFPFSLLIFSKCWKEVFLTTKLNLIMCLWWSVLSILVWWVLLRWCLYYISLRGPCPQPFHWWHCLLKKGLLFLVLVMLFISFSCLITLSVSPKQYTAVMEVAALLHCSPPSQLHSQHFIIIYDDDKWVKIHFPQILKYAPTILQQKWFLHFIRCLVARKEIIFLPFVRFG